MSHPRHCAHEKHSTQRPGRAVLDRENFCCLCAFPILGIVHLEELPAHRYDVHKRGRDALGVLHIGPAGTAYHTPEVQVVYSEADGLVVALEVRFLFGLCFDGERLEGMVPGVGEAYKTPDARLGARRGVLERRLLWYWRGRPLNYEPSVQRCMVLDVVANDIPPSAGSFQRLKRRGHLVDGVPRLASAATPRYSALCLLWVRSAVGPGLETQILETRHHFFQQRARFRA